MALALPDYYTLRARLLPAVLAAIPPLSLAAIWISWDSFSLSQLLATIAIFCVLYAFSVVARREGKRIEPLLKKKTGGQPTTTMLRYRDDTFTAEQKKRYHAFLAKQLKEKAPAASDEAKDPAKADGFYQRAGDWLRTATANRKRFNILFDELITYGCR